MAESPGCFRDRTLTGKTGAKRPDGGLFFESVQTPWNGGLDNIKREIRESREPYVSFDIFDTLVVRPFYEPSDIFMLLNPKAQELLGTFISFDQIRREGEMLAREYYGMKYGWEDITLREIYDFISEHYGIGRETTDRIMQLRRSLNQVLQRPPERPRTS